MSERELPDDGLMQSSLVGRLRLQFHDVSRFWSAELTRVFASSTRAGLVAPSSALSAAPDAVPLIAVVAEMSTPLIVRGND